MHIQSTSWCRCVDQRYIWFSASNDDVLLSKYASVSYTLNDKLMDLGLTYRRMFSHSIDFHISKCSVELSIAKREQHWFWHSATKTRFCVEGEKKANDMHAISW
jgi:hypothetical protein